MVERKIIKHIMFLYTTQLANINIPTFEIFLFILLTESND